MNVSDIKVWHITRNFMQNLLPKLPSDGCVANYCRHMSWRLICYAVATGENSCLFLANKANLFRMEMLRSSNIFHWVDDRRYFIGMYVYDIVQEWHLVELTHSAFDLNLQWTCNEGIVISKRSVLKANFSSFHNFHLIVQSNLSPNNNILEGHNWSPKTDEMLQWVAFHTALNSKVEPAPKMASIKDYLLSLRDWYLFSEAWWLYL